MASGRTMSLSVVFLVTRVAELRSDTFVAKIPISELDINTCVVTYEREYFTLLPRNFVCQFRGVTLGCRRAVVIFEAIAMWS